MWILLHHLKETEKSQVGYELGTASSRPLHADHTATGSAVYVLLIYKVSNVRYLPSNIIFLQYKVNTT